MHTELVLYTNESFLIRTQMHSIFVFGMAIGRHKHSNCNWRLVERQRKSKPSNVLRRRLISFEHSLQYEFLTVRYGSLLQTNWICLSTSCSHSSTYNFFFVTYFVWNEFQNIQMINYSGWLVMPCVYSTTTIQSVVIRTLIFEIKSPYCLINGLSFCIQYKSGQIGWCDLLYHRCKSPFILSIKSYSSFATSYINKNQF